MVMTIERMLPARLHERWNLENRENAGGIANGKRPQSQTETLWSETLVSFTSGLRLRPQTLVSVKDNVTHCLTETLFV